MKYNVLWIDDEHEQQNEFILAAEQEDIDIVAFATHQEGFDYLEKNLGEIDAVILDVINDQESGAAKYNDFTASKDRLNQLYEKKAVPFFVFSGQTSVDKDISIQGFIGKYYSKHRDPEKLLEDVKKAIDSNDFFQTKERYKKVFSVCDTIKLDADSKEHLLKILHSIHFSAPQFDESLYLNPIRKILEALFYEANQRGLLHDKCVQNGSVVLAWSCDFLAGKEVEIKPSGERIRCEKPHLPKLIADAVYHIKEVTNAASHYGSDPSTSEKDHERAKAQIRELREYIKTPYLLYSLTFQLLDVLLWFKAYIDQHPDPGENRDLWIDLGALEPIEGSLLNNGNCYSVKNCQITNKQVQINGFKIGSIVKVTKYDKNTNPTNNFDYFAHEFEKVN